MKTKIATAALCLVVLANYGQAQLLVLEPDAYLDATVLNHVRPEVSLVTAGANNLPIPFDVWARHSTFPFMPPTGSNVFSHAGVPFWNTDRQLRMDFAGVISTLSIDFQGGTTGSPERGTLEVYNAQNVLLTSYLTALLPGGQIETMSINRVSPDIAYAIAYTLPGQTSFGRLDHLVFSTPVPEPSAFALLGAGFLGALAVRRRTRRGQAE